MLLFDLLIGARTPGSCCTSTCTCASGCAPHPLGGVSLPAGPACMQTLESCTSSPGTEQWCKRNAGYSPCKAVTVCVVLLACDQMLALTTSAWRQTSLAMRQANFSGMISPIQYTDIVRLDSP